MSLFSSGVHGALEVIIRGEVITEEAVSRGEGCGRCCSGRRSRGGGGVPGQGETGGSGKAGEVLVCLLPASMILAKQRWSVSTCIPPPERRHREQRGSAPSAAELHHVRSTVRPCAGLQCPDHTDSWSGAIFFIIFFFISHETELDPRYRGNQQP